LSQSLEFLKGVSDQAKANEEALRVAKQNSELLKQIQRAVDPVDAITACAWIDVDLTDKRLADYRNRVVSAIEADTKGVKGMDLRLPDGIRPSITESDGTLDEIAIPRSSPLFPNEKSETLAYYLINYIDFEIRVSDSKVEPDPKKSTQMSFSTAEDSTRADNPSVELTFDLKQKQFGIDALDMRSESKYWENFANILFTVDLVWQVYQYQLSFINGAKFSGRNPDITDLRTKLRLKTMVIYLPRGREFWIRNPQSISDEKSLQSYSFQVPDFLSPNYTP
jgi:hypothetical protein